LTVESNKSSVLYCANHPSVETSLRCSRCGKPICVRCVVQTPVGGRCRECANVRKAPIFLVGPRRYARAAAYGLATSVVGGFIWASMGGFFGLSCLLLLLLGYLVGEAVSRGADGCISRGLTVMAGIFTVLAALIGRAGIIFVSLPAALPLSVRLQAAAGLGVQGILGITTLLFLALAVVVAVSRVR